MAYTHYFRYRAADPGYADAWPTCVADAARVVAAVRGFGVSVAGPHGDGEPIIDPVYGIRFNGRLDDDTAAETFNLIAPGPVVAGIVGDFCKTARRPYDLAVATVLLRCLVLAPDVFSVASDGDWDGEWLHGATAAETGAGPGAALGARRLYEALFGPLPDGNPLRSR